MIYFKSLCLGSIHLFWQAVPMINHLNGSYHSLIDYHSSTSNKNPEATAVNDMEEEAGTEIFFICRIVITSESFNVQKLANSGLVKSDKLYAIFSQNIQHSYRHVKVAGTTPVIADRKF